MVQQPSEWLRTIRLTDPDAVRTAGSGKSWALARYCEEHAGAWFATMSPSLTSPAAMLQRIATVLGESMVYWTAARVERAVIARLSIGTALIVIDEANHLSQPLLDVVRCVYDAAGCGLILIGAAELLE